MAGARIRVVASIYWFTLFVGTHSAAIAEQSDDIRALSALAGSYTEQQVSLPGCAQPDQRTLEAIVPVATDHGSHASGVVYDDNRVLTAAHAVQGAGNFFVRIGSMYRAADLVMVDHRHDLAVLAVDTGRIKPLRFSLFSLTHADPVWAAGYPRAQSMTMSAGTLQSFNGGILHTSATIDSGQSGGGLLSCTAGTWSLVGMLRGFGAYVQGDEYIKLENHSVSVAGATINEFLNTYH